MKDEVRVKNNDFQGDLFFFRGLDLVWESATPPTHIWERYPKKNVFFLAASLSLLERSPEGGRFSILTF